MSQFFDCEDPEQRTAGFEAARAAILAKQCVVMPTDTVYGIAADAFSPQAVATLLAAKGRGRNMPPPVLIPQVSTMQGLARDIPEAVEKVVGELWPGPLTVILHAQPSLTWDLGETKGTVALRVPDDALALELLAVTGPLAVSSANRSGQPAGTTAAEARDMLVESVEVYLEDGKRPLTTDPFAGEALPSTIVDYTSEVPTVVRLGAVSLELLQELDPAIRMPEAEAEEEAEADAEAVAEASTETKHQESTTETS
ncbi:L-threonylcarbamoyladenylate synthase [Neomicrococcus lactis]|uniref:L-threonylcarbamoyladenylate synthase n=1 Tax=Neomicrococcus lactis TaxID=732241 RepID=UPI00230049D3|nr:L-threonylcarbamoyladenylate synthase [Neomicrococcus lactis]